MIDVVDIERYEPKRERWRELWTKWSATVRQERFAAALKRQAQLLEWDADDAPESERSRVRRHPAKITRGSLRRWRERYAKFGIDGLVDWRTPPDVPAMPNEVLIAICTMRRLDPNVDVDVIVEHVARHHAFKTSETVVRRVLREHGLARRSGPAPNSESDSEKHWELGGMKLVEAALVETGYLMPGGKWSGWNCA